MSVFLRLKKILYQNDLRSRPVRENFQEIENGVNDLQAQIDAIITPASNAEITNARDYHLSVRDRIRNLTKALGKNVLIGGGAVTPNGSNMKVSVAAGEAVINGIGCSWGAYVSGTITAPGTVGQARLDVVVANSDNSISIVTGTAAASGSEKPEIITSAQKALAIVRVIYGQTVIVSGDISTVYRESAIVGSNIWMVERNPNMDFHFEAPVTGNFTLKLPWNNLVAGDRIKITNNRNPSSAGILNHYYIRVQQYQGGSWILIETVWNGGSELCVQTTNPGADQIVIAQHTVGAYVSGAYCSGASASSLTPIVFNNYLYVRSPNPNHGWNLTTGQWTAPSDGIIQIEINGYHNDSDGGLRVLVYKNGSDTTEAWDFIRSIADSPLRYFVGTFTIPVAAGDIVDLRPNANATGIVAGMKIHYIW